MVTRRPTNAARTPAVDPAGAAAAAVPESFAAFVALVPKLRNPIQLAGFLFSVFAAALIRYVNPANVQAIVVVGAIGVALVAIPLLYHPGVLRLFPPMHRLILVLSTLVILLVSFGALAVATAVGIKLPPQGARFDSMLEPQNVRVISADAAGTQRLEIIWRLVPLSTIPDQSATIFIGLVSLHDESQIKDEGIGAPSTALCEQVPSCIGARVFKEYETRPIFVKAGSPGSNLTTVVDVKRLPKTVRVWWEFYQREGVDDNICGFDNRLAGPAAGIPPLAMFDPQGKRVADACYRSFGQRTVRL